MKKIKKKIKTPGAKILLFDIETMANLGYTWGKYDQNVIKFKKEWQMLSFAYKWVGESKIHCYAREGQKSDKALTRVLHKLFNEADVLIAHNGDEFDIKKVKARMIFHGMRPPKVLASIDTKKAAKQNFAFTGNSLDELAQYFKVGKKLQHKGFEMWEGCEADDPASWRNMVRYNKHDVKLLEGVYQRMRPWIQNHPNLGRFLDPDLITNSRCPTCGSRDTSKDGIRITRSGVQQRWKCKACAKTWVTPYKRQ